MANRETDRVITMGRERGLVRASVITTRVIEDPRRAYMGPRKRSLVPFPD